MGLCYGKEVKKTPIQVEDSKINYKEKDTSPKPETWKTRKYSLYMPSPLPNFYKNSPLNSRLTSPPSRVLKKAFPPPSPAKHIKSFLARRHVLSKSSKSTIDEGREDDLLLSKNFGYLKDLHSNYELGDVVGRGHFGYTCSAKMKKGEEVAVKVIPKGKLSTVVAVEDVQREVKILSSLSRHKNLVQFYDAYEDDENVYIVMELCKGGELLESILTRGGKYSEDDAKHIIIQVLGVVASFHLQGVVHRDLKPENFLFVSEDEKSSIKAIDFGLSDFLNPDDRLNDIVGSAYYVAPEVLHRSYGSEADIWSIGVIAYILLCGSRPFWARTESGIFRSVLKAIPNFEDDPWPSLTSEAKDFIVKLLDKDYRRRLTASQALSHPWLRNCKDAKICLDISIIRFVRAYICSSSLRKSALRALAKTLTVEELFYLREQFSLLSPSKNGFISIQNFKKALLKYSTKAMELSRVHDSVELISSLQYKKLDFEEFVAAALNVYQLEGLDCWEQRAHNAYAYFDKDGNKQIMIQELASELGLGLSVPIHIVIQEHIRHTDGKLSFVGFMNLLRGVPSSSISKLV